MSKAMIAPSILSADFSKMGEEIISLNKSGADLIHCDVMDGVFVKNITFGPKMIKDIRGITNLDLDVHLMIVDPERYIENFASAGADIITIHKEATKDTISTLKAIKSLGKRCGIVINPDTPVSSIYKEIEESDMVLLMSVFPGFGGQKFIEYVLPKVAEVKKIVDGLGREINIEIDGGINLSNVQKVKDAGANVIVAGNTVFTAENRKETIDLLRG